MIQVRRAGYKDIPHIMEFIDCYWKQNHILAVDQKFFEWQFCPYDEVNMVLGIDDADGKIYGIQGFILYNRGTKPDISGSIWKTIRSNNVLLGMELEQAVKDVTNYRWCASPGLSKKALRLNELQGGYSIQMEHYYQLGHPFEYKIASITEEKRNKYVDCIDITFKEIKTEQEFNSYFSEDYLSTFLPYKGQEYFAWRYYNHPIYSYKIIGIQLKNGTIRSAFVYRCVEQFGHLVYKIVDYIGIEEDFGSIGRYLDGLLQDERVEYIDLYSLGISRYFLECAGFVYRSKDDSNIIPNYFEPYVSENVDINLIYPWGQYRMFRGDGDQDRPSISRKKEKENML